MCYYVKLVYQHWCQNLSTEQIEEKKEDFILMAAKKFARSEVEMRSFLSKSDWFI